MNIYYKENNQFDTNDVIVFYFKHMYYYIRDRYYQTINMTAPRVVGIEGLKG